MIQLYGENLTSPVRENAAHALAILSGSRHNALLTGRLMHGLADDIGICGKSVRLRDTKSGNYLFSAQTLEEFDSLCQSAAEPVNTFFLSDNALEEPLRARGLDVQVFHQWLIDRDAELLPDVPGFTFAPARLCDLDRIVSMYNSPEFGRDYVADIIRENHSMCAYQDGRMVGFVLAHKDGEAGPMIVSEHYRGRGLGEALLRHITGLMRTGGFDPVCLIHPNNHTSERLHAKVGYRRCIRPVLWVYQADFFQR